MADSSNENSLQLLKRFGAYLTLKLSNLFSISNLSSRSVGTVAGLAIAMVLTWRLLRPPSGNQRRQPKRNVATTAAAGSSGANTTTVSATSETVDSAHLRAQNLLNDFLQSANPTLGQVVKQKLYEGRKVTCRLLGVILEESSPEEIQKQATVRSSVLEVLLEITKFCDLYLMDRILDDESGEKVLLALEEAGVFTSGGLVKDKVLLALEEAGVFTSGGLVKDKVLFCSTEIGRISFVRQLEPDWHIDTNPDITFQLARFIKYQLHISANKPERTASNVFCSSSLERFFGL